MRRVSLFAVAALAVSACGGQQAQDEGSNTAQDVSVQNLGAGGDVTAIDAATSADANMAADVEYNLADLNEANASEAEGNAN